MARSASTGRSVRRRVELVDAFERREVRLDRVDSGAEFPECGRGLVDRGLVGGDHEIEAVLRAALSKLVADTGRGAGNDGERTFF